MTTITNFLHSNFVSSTFVEGAETPIWVVSGDRSQKIMALKQYLIDISISSNKAVVHVDLGLSTLRLLKNCNNKVQLDKNLVLYAPQKDKQYFVLKANSQYLKTTKNSLSKIIEHLNKLTQSIATFKLQTTNKNSYSFSLVVQGLQLVESQQQFKFQLQSFINSLSTLKNVYRQISIFKYTDVLLPEHQFCLERISTCLTELLNYENGNWVVKSTIRRYTGFSNEEKYVIKTIKTQNNNRLKVEKWQAPKDEGDLKYQKQLQQQLGFVVKKGDKGIKQDELKKLIYPHLMVQNQSKCEGDKQCKNAGCKTPQIPDQELIILDDQQQDDDDIDV